MTATDTLLIMDLFLQGTQRVARIAFSLNLRKQILLTLQKVRMLKYLLVAALYFGLVEVIHIQLADER